MSPCGGSSFTTSAPMSASTVVPNGPARELVRSSTFTPASKLDRVPTFGFVLPPVIDDPLLWLVMSVPSRMVLAATQVLRPHRLASCHLSAELLTRVSR